jgi:hypothetical protein
MKIILTLLWIGVCISVALGALILGGGMMSATGAPQEAVVCCLALCFAVLPYVFTRAVEGIALAGSDRSAPAELSSAQRTSHPLSPTPEPSAPQYNFTKLEKRKDEDTITSLKL